MILLFSSTKDRVMPIIFDIGLRGATPDQMDLNAEPRWPGQPGTVFLL